MDRPSRDNRLWLGQLQTYACGSPLCSPLFLRSDFNVRNICLYMTRGLNHPLPVSCTPAPFPTSSTPTSVVPPSSSPSTLSYAGSWALSALNSPSPSKMVSVTVGHTPFSAGRWLFQLCAQISLRSEGRSGERTHSYVIQRERRMMIRRLAAPLLHQVATEPPRPSIDEVRIDNSNTVKTPSSSINETEM